MGNLHPKKDKYELDLKNINLFHNRDCLHSHPGILGRIYAARAGADFVLIEENSISEKNCVDNTHLNVAGQQEKAYVILKSIEGIVASVKL